MGSSALNSFPHPQKATSPDTNSYLRYSVGFLQDLPRLGKPFQQTIRRGDSKVSGKSIYPIALMDHNVLFCVATEGAPTDYLL